MTRGYQGNNALLFVNISPVVDLDDPDNIGRLYFEQDTVVADPKSARSSKTVAKRFPELDRIGA